MQNEENLNDCEKEEKGERKKQNERRSILKYRYVIKATMANKVITMMDLNLMFTLTFL